MSNKKRLISISFVAIAVATTIFLWNSFSAEADAAIIRFDGLTRYDTAVKTSTNGWKNGSNTVIIVSGKDYPDALSAAPLAKKYNAPILLSEVGGLNNQTIQELGRLKAKNAYIVGGTSAVPSNVEGQLKSLGINSTRLSGYDRYETAVKVAEIVGTSNGIVLASGTSFADALSIAPIAAANGMPILLTLPNKLSNYNKAFITGKNIGVTYVIGGDTVIAGANVNNYPNPVRLGGLNRYETNTNVLQYFAQNINYDKMYLASGLNFPDGLVGAPIAALTQSPIILINDNSSCMEQINSKLTGVNPSELYVLGGQTVLSDSLVNKIAYSIKEFKVISIE